MIGVDPHKASHTAAALDEHGHLLGEQRIAASVDGYQELRRWAGRWPQRCWAVEGAHGIGPAPAQRLVGDGEQVVDVPAKLATRVRVLSTGHGRKSDPHDAVSVAVAARHAPSLRQVGMEDQATVLHLLTKRRQDLVAARTQTINRLHRLLMDLVPGGARRNLTTKRAAAVLAAVTPAGAPAVTRWQLATELIADARQLEQRIAAVEAPIKDAVAQANTSLLELFGVGPVLAATFLGEVGDIGRFPTKHHFAAHTGTAPLEASSGQVVRHRLSRAGDRKLNYALYMMAMVQVRRPSAGQVYYRRKLAEGKSPKEALRCLERRLSDAVYRCLLADARSRRSPDEAITSRPTTSSRHARSCRVARGHRTTVVKEP
jgi:transposase